jgi:tetratricopeptide (TPR) repeat protein
VLVRNARGWEDGAVWQLAAYLTAFSAAPALASRAVQDLIEPRRTAGMIIDLQWFAALLHLESGELTTARRVMTEAMSANAAVPTQWDRRVFELVTEWWAAALPLPYADSTLRRIRRTAASSRVSLWQASFQPPGDGDPLWLALKRQALGTSNRIEALRLYTIGALSLRLGDVAETSMASASLERLAAADASDWFVRALEHELRARRAWHAGKADQALRILDEIQLGPVSVGANMVVPFFAHAQRRYLRGELLTALGRDAEALPWFASLGGISAPESAFRAPAHLRQAEIYERLGNRSEAARHYARFIELWRDSDPELRPLVETARKRQIALSR